MKILIQAAIVAGLLKFLASCGPAPIDEQPSLGALAGEYEATLEDGKVSRLYLSEEGFLTAVSVPVRSMGLSKIEHHTIQDLGQLQAPSNTPSGTWSLEVDGQFFQIYRDGEEVLFKLPYDVLNNKTATYLAVSD